MQGLRAKHHLFADPILQADDAISNGGAQRPSHDSSDQPAVQHDIRGPTH
jgi:hypothetical protein